MTRIFHKAWCRYIPNAKQVRSVQAITMFVIYTYYNNGRVFLTGETSCLLKETWSSGRWLTLLTANSLWACRSAANPVSAKNKRTNDLLDNAVLLLFLEHCSWGSRTIICNCKKWQSCGFIQGWVQDSNPKVQVYVQIGKYCLTGQLILFTLSSAYFRFIFSFLSQFVKVEGKQILSKVLENMVWVKIYTFKKLNMC